jgi:ubiquinone/menaquinone biosynthesis C-methylase UbiE
MLRGSLLHIGAGGGPLPEWAQGVDEKTLDIDAQTGPDYVASMTDMGEVGQFDFVYSCHCLEHVFPHEAKKALKEMKRVLVDGGTNLCIVPDLGGIKPTHDTIYESLAGPVCGLDIMYGMASLIEENPYMAHKTGFTMDSLKDEFKEAGFKNITGTVINDFHSIMVTGEK